MTQKMYLYILKAGIYLSLISVFLVSKSLLFPYISTKQIYFNILIEVLMVFWLAFIVKFREYRPKKSYITYGLSAYFLVVLISCFAGVDFGLSFWGDVERMLGFFHIFHFFLFYLILITIMREWRDWKKLFVVSIIFANLVSLNGIGGNPFSTIGNTAYVCGYLIFNIYFVLILFFKEKDKSLRWLYIAALPLQLVAFKNADSSGAFVGLGFSVLVFFFLYGVLCENKKLRKYTLSAGAVALILVILLFTNKNSDFVKNDSLLNRVNEISFQKNTFQTRLISWKAAGKDFKNHPLLGTGHGNYAITFDKYFDSKFYTFTSSETYFDRAHNNLIDIVSTTGMLGLLTYLSIFVAAAYYLIRGFYEKRIKLMDFTLVSCLVIAYFVQNLAVFDSLVTYMGIMMTLAFIYFLYGENGGIGESISQTAGKAKRQIFGDEQGERNELLILIFASIISLTIIYQCNVLPLQVLVGTIKGHIAFQQGETEKSYEIFKQALLANTGLNRDANTIFIRLFSEDIDKLKSLDKNKAQEIIDYGVKLAEENVAHNQGDSMSQIMLSQILDAAARFNSENNGKFVEYSDRSLKAVDSSITASPGRATNYFFKAQILANRGDYDGSIAVLRYAVSLNDKYSTSQCYLAKFLLFFQKPEAEIYQNMDLCIDLDGLNDLTADVIRRIVNHYLSAGDFVRVEKIVLSLTEKEVGNIENWVNLIKLYGQMGEKEKARAAADKAIEIDYSVKEYADEYVNSIK
ncbi:MAG: O-antigen ligase family protein [Candidatus Magasanikbacteria bacterium]|nr:O-antigen ligase family protein [Candidatus Magasanikbacteria bacterium]